MSIYLPSANVRAFPLAKERTEVGDSSSLNNSRLLTEFNVSNILRQIMGNKQCFIISTYLSESASEKKLNVKFNLRGYYFDVDFDSDILNGLENGKSYAVYAALEYHQENQYELKQDNEYNKYEGLSLEFVDKSTFDVNSIGSDYVHLLDINKDADGTLISVVNKEDYFIFDNRSLPIGGIDGKPKQ